MPGIVRKARGAGRWAAERLLKPVRPVLGNLASIPLTLIGTASIDFAAFHLAHGWGWLVTGVSLYYIEHLIADES